MKVFMSMPEYGWLTSIPEELQEELAQDLLHASATAFVKKERIASQGVQAKLRAALEAHRLEHGIVFPGKSCKTD